MNSQLGMDLAHTLVGAFFIKDRHMYPRTGRPYQAWRLRHHWLPKSVDRFIFPCRIAQSLQSHSILLWLVHMMGRTFEQLAKSPNKLEVSFHLGLVIMIFGVFLQQTPLHATQSKRHGNVTSRVFLVVNRGGCWSRLLGGSQSWRTSWITASMSNRAMVHGAAFGREQVNRFLTLYLLMMMM